MPYKKRGCDECLMPTPEDGKQDPDICEKCDKIHGKGTPLKQYDVEGFGKADEFNSVFSIFLEDTDKETFRSLKVGQSETLTFKSGQGKSVSKVTRTH